jgi:hypothetical protein
MAVEILFCHPEACEGTKKIATDSPALAQRPNKNHEMQISSFSIREFAAQKKNP